MPTHYLLLTQHDITNDCCITVIYHKQHLPVSKLITTNQVDTERNNYYDTQSFATPREHNHRTPEIPETATTTTTFQPNVYSYIFERSYPTSTTSFKKPPSEIFFQSDGKSDHEA